MALMQWSGLTPLHFDELNQEWVNFFNRTLEKIKPLQEHVPLRDWSPDFDIFERAHELVVRVDLPGISKDDVHISVKGDLLIIFGERRTDGVINAEQYYYRHCPHGIFRRDIQLHHGVDTENIKASYKNGVLEIVLPEKEGVKRQRVEISVE